MTQSFCKLPMPCLTITFVFFSDMLVMLKVFTLVGRMGSTSAYIFLFVFFTELMPTVVRNMGLGITTTAAFAGSIMSPYVIYMGKCL